MREFGMFTGAGEEMANEFVAFARKWQLTDKSIVESMWAISETELFAEFSDTAVRESVFAAISEVRETWSY